MPGSISGAALAGRAVKAPAGRSPDAGGSAICEGLMGAYLLTAAPVPTGITGTIPCTTPKVLSVVQARLCLQPNKKCQTLSQKPMWQELASASFWPAIEPGSLVLSYFCLAWSISQMKDIQSLDSEHFGSEKLQSVRGAVVANFSGFKAKYY